MLNPQLQPKRKTLIRDLTTGLYYVAVIENNGRRSVYFSDIYEAQTFDSREAAENELVEFFQYFASGEDGEIFAEIVEVFHFSKEEQDANKKL